MSLPNSLTLHLDITGYPCKCPCVSSECSEGTCKGKDLVKEAPKLWGVCSGVVVPPNVQVSHHSLPAKRVLGLLLLQLLPGEKSLKNCLLNKVLWDKRQVASGSCSCTQLGKT